MNKVPNASDAIACPGRGAARNEVERCTADPGPPKRHTGARRPAAAWCEEPTYACGRIRSIVSGLLFTMKTATRTCKLSARGAMRSPTFVIAGPSSVHSRASGNPEPSVRASGFWVPAFAGTNGCCTKGGAYFAGLGFELRSGAPPGLNPKLPSSSSAACSQVRAISSKTCRWRCDLVSPAQRMHSCANSRNSLGDAAMARSTRGQAGARPVSQPPVPDQRSRPVINITCARDCLLANHIFGSRQHTPWARMLPSDIGIVGAANQGITDAFPNSKANLTMVLFGHLHLYCFHA